MERPYSQKVPKMVISRKILKIDPPQMRKKWKGGALSATKGVKWDQNWRWTVKKKLLLGRERMRRQTDAIISISSNYNIDVSKNGDVEYK